MPATPKSVMRTRRQDQARQRYQDAKARKACVEAVWKREQMNEAGWSACEYCGASVNRWTDFPPMRGHVHERLARSLGGDPTNPNHCVLTCHPCHLPSGAHRRSVRAE